MVRYSVGHDFSRWGCWVGLCVVAQVIALHVVCNVVGHPWLPKVVSDKFCHLPPARVASDWVVVVGFHYVKLQLTFVGDKDPSPINYHPFLFFSFIAAQPSPVLSSFSSQMTESSWSVQLQTQSRKSVSSPSNMMPEGPSLFAARDFLSSVRIKNL